MRSWDCWDTLIARRSVTDIHDERDNVFPIAENVKRVEPGDILVSDYYDEPLLRSIVPAITGLCNRLIVSEDGKLSGRVWSMLRNLGVTEHLGDNPNSDVESPQAHGIRGSLSIASKFTDAEQSLNDIGFVGLARCIREARLIRHSDTLRNLELSQTQINFPALFIASVILQRDHRHDRLLMSSRDCFLWHRLQEFVRDLHADSYEVIYFKTSRLARVFPSRSYTRYVENHLPAAIVDVYGTGWSLSRFLQNLGHPETPILFITRCNSDAVRRRCEAIARTESDGNIAVLLKVSSPAMSLEGLNLASHAMYADPPETFNPLGLDWEGMPEIQAMHGAFYAALDAAQRYDFRTDLEVADSVLQSELHACFLRATQHSDLIEVVNEIAYSEHEPIMTRLEQMARSGSQDNN
jgi:hypothetical protein